MKKRTLKILFLLVLLFGIGFFFLRDGTITGYTVWEKPSKLSSSANCPDCNVILIIVDTLRADHVGAYGYDRDTTPNIDKLAEEGIIFKNTIAQSSWTKPSTASILTGLYPKNHGAYNREDRLAEDNVLLSEILKDNGYDTHAFVANPTVGGTAGFNQSYDTFLESIYPDDYSDTLNEKLIPVIENLEKTSKQFIYVHYMDPHNPYQPREGHFSKSNSDEFTQEFAPGLFSSFPNTPTVEKKIEKQRALVPEVINLYDDEVLFNDKMIGDVIQTLKDKKMYDNSIIIVVSDHGEEFMDHGRWLHGENLYDEQLLVPWITRLPGWTNQEIEKQVGHIDMLPTILSLLDIPIPDGIDGTNLLAREGKEGGERVFIYSELNQQGYVFASVRSLNEKLIEGILVNRPIMNSYTWFENEANVEITQDNSLITIMSFFKERPLQIAADNRVLMVANINSKPINLNFKSDSDRTTYQITSLLPCKNMSDFGVNDSRCLSFGISTFEEDTEGTHPIYNYFSLKDDSLEQKNLYYEPQYKERVGQLREELDSYLQTRRKRTAPQEAVQYSEEQLEALKALGYI